MLSIFFDAADTLYEKAAQGALYNTAGPVNERGIGAAFTSLQLRTVSGLAFGKPMQAFRVAVFMQTLPSVSAASIGYSKCLDENQYLVARDISRNLSL
jgi:hypothetical protein